MSDTRIELYVQHLHTMWFNVFFKKISTITFINPGKSTPLVNVVRKRFFFQFRLYERILKIIILIVLFIVCFDNVTAYPSGLESSVHNVGMRVHGVLHGVPVFRRWHSAAVGQSVQ